MKHVFLCGLIAFAAVSCRPTQPAPPAPAATLPATFGTAPATAADSTSAGDLPWRQFFGDDAALVGLLDTALRQNPDLLQATQRVAVARAEVLARRGALLPTVNSVLSAGADRFGAYTLNGVGNFDTNKSPNIDGNQRIPTRPTPDFFVGLRSSWEIDLWGRLRANRRAAVARLLATDHGRRLVQTDLVAEVARTYFELLALDQELEILDRNARLQERAVAISRVQKQGGRATELAVQQFVAQWRRTLSLTAETRQRIVANENTLNQLLGRYPRPVRRGAPLLAQPLPAAVRVGVPTTLLRRRPDVRRAEQELAATQADVVAARAAFLPSLTLTPYVGLNAFDASLLFRAPESLAAGALAGLTTPLFNRAGLKAGLSGATARQIEAYYAYQQTLQTGVAEVVTNLRGLDHYATAYDERTREVAALNKAVEVSNELFLAGYASYLEVITAQRSVLEAELSRVEARREQFYRLIGLYRALGGGWE